MRSAQIRAVGVPDWMFCGTYEAQSLQKVSVSCAPGRAPMARIGRLFPEARLRASPELSVMASAWASGLLLAEAGVQLVQAVLCAGCG